MEKSNTKFAKRLHDAMVAAGYEAKPAVLEREFNLRYWGKPMTLHGVRKWLLGESLPKQEKVLVLAEWLQIPPQELRYGVEVEQRIQQKRTRWHEGLGHQERELLEAYLDLPVIQRKIVRDVVQAFTKAFPPNTPAKKSSKK